MKKAIRYTYTAITINLIIAILILLILGLNKMVAEIPLGIGMGVVALYVVSFFVAPKLDYLINQRGMNGILVGIVGLFVILLVSIFMGTTIEWIFANTWRKFRDYFLFPFSVILIVGFIPTLIAGALLGSKIQEKSNQDTDDLLDSNEIEM